MFGIGNKKERAPKKSLAEKINDFLNEPPKPLTVKGIGKSALDIAISCMYFWGILLTICALIVKFC